MNDLLMIYSLVDLNCLDQIGVNILILLGILDFALHPDNESFDKRYMHFFYSAPCYVISV